MTIMKKNLITAILLIFASITSAQNQNSLLWEISGNGLQKPSYLFGTIHMIPKKDYFFTDQMSKSLKNCESLVVEINMFSLSLAQQVNLVKQVILPQDKTIKQYMDSIEYFAFRQFLIDSLNIKKKKIDKRYIRIKPFFLTALLMQDYVGKTKTYEQELYKLSKKNKMELKALENIEFQMGLAEKMTIEEQIEGMTDMESFSMYYEMVELYKKQNIKDLYNISMQEYKTDEELDFLKVFIDDRNADWIPKIENLTKESSCFIAFGALHLPGKKGVIQLLKNKGYTIKPIISN